MFTPFVVPLSVLDLAPVASGEDTGAALAHSAELVALAERLGYRRHWVAEHHNMPGIASSAPAVLLAHLAAATSTIRLGSGGVMLPNHAPLVVAEQFGMLEALHPGRIDLGLGRAPGTDPATMRALRRSRVESADDFPQDVAELQRLLAPAVAGQRLIAMPGAGTEVPSSLACPPETSAGTLLFRPTNSATNGVAGLAYRSAGAASCSSLPWLITPTRSATASASS